MMAELEAKIDDELSRKSVDTEYLRVLCMQIGYIPAKRRAEIWESFLG